MEKGSCGETAAPVLPTCRKCVLYKLRLIYAQSQGKIKKKPRSELITRVKIERNKKNVTKKLRREMQENRLLEEQCAGCTVRRMHNARRN